MKRKRVKNKLHYSSLFFCAVFLCSYMLKNVFMRFYELKNDGEGEPLTL